MWYCHPDRVQGCLEGKPLGISVRELHKSVSWGGKPTLNLVVLTYLLGFQTELKGGSELSTSIHLYFWLGCSLSSCLTFLWCSSAWCAVVAEPQAERNPFLKLLSPTYFYHNNNKIMNAAFSYKWSLLENPEWSQISWHCMRNKNPSPIKNSASVQVSHTFLRVGLPSK